MIDYRAGNWGFHVAAGWNGSLAPRALTMAIPNGIITFIVATLINQSTPDDFNEDGTANAFEDEATSNAAQTVMATFTVVMLFILYNRSRTSYNRWWEGGTLLQKTRGEWFNAYSSIMAFTSTKPELQDQVEAYCHLLARLMSLLMCCGLQQVSPNRDRTFEIIDLEGIEAESMDFLNAAPDKVEVIMQWIQRSIVLQTGTGVLPVAPPILSRAFQEVSRGIVNLQNARKIADFPYPFPLAQICMILQLMHWAVTPIAAALALPRVYAVLLAFFSIFVLWCIHFNALDLEFPFGARVNDLPMDSFQQDWNKSIVTLLHKRATRPPGFAYDQEVHNNIDIVMSDASELHVPKVPPPLDKGVAHIVVTSKKNSKQGLRRSLQISQVLGAYELSRPRFTEKENEASEPLASTKDASAPTKLEPEMPAKKEGPDIPGNHVPVATGSSPGSTPSASSQPPGNQSSQTLTKQPVQITPLTLDSKGVQTNALLEDLVADERSTRNNESSLPKIAADVRSAASNQIALNTRLATTDERGAAGSNNQFYPNTTKLDANERSGNQISLNTRQEKNWPKPST